MRAVRRVLSTIAAGVALAAVTAAPASAAAPMKVTLSGSGPSADAVFSNLPDGVPVEGFWGLADDNTWLSTFPIARLNTPLLFDAWRTLSSYPHPPEACLVNLYAPSARMGLHQDRDESTFDAPVVSISLGATAVFRIGGLERRDRTRSIRLSSGDAFVFGGPARLAFHGIDRLVPGSSTLLEGDRRINLTLRRVTRPESRTGEVTFPPLFGGPPQPATD